jgi:multidrug efflux pump subunit AcrA (membrane-fusion protein)
VTQQPTALSALELVRPARLDRIITRTLAAGVVVIALVLWLTPWQQTAPGSGRVIASATEERRQNIEAPIEGRVKRWHVQEGVLVQRGDPLVELTDNDPELMTRLQAERAALVARADAAADRARSIGQRIAALESSRKDALSGAESRVRMADQRALAAEQAVSLAKATLATAQLNLERQQGLAAKGLTSKRSLELAELDSTRAQTELERANVGLQSARNEQGAIAADRGKVGNDAFAALNDARASQASAEAEMAAAHAEIARLDVRMSRQNTQSITAPRAGKILRIVANGHMGDIVKAGDLLAVLVPEVTDRAVEIWVSGNDMPLVQPGAAVRVQFEGWPALQFSGWPQVAVGTFAGRVSLVDATDDGMGKFRVLLAPERQSEWPDARYLRQGVRVHAWVQLNEVRLGYELWRQFNGFPPSLPSAPSDGAPASKKEAS